MTQAINNFIIRPAEQDDSKTVWQIRNHALARKYSKNPLPIAFDKHQEWFVQKYFSGQDNHCFVLEDSNNKLLGYCRFDLTEKQNNENVFFVSIAIDARHHGRGLGSYLLANCLKKLKAKIPVLAEVKSSNMAGLRLFQKNNFQLIKETAEIKYLQFQNNFL